MSDVDVNYPEVCVNRAKTIIDSMERYMNSNAQLSPSDIQGTVDSAYTLLLLAEQFEALEERNKYSNTGEVDWR